MLSRVRLNSTQELLTSRPDLINEAAKGVLDVLTIQGLDNTTSLSTGGEATASYISAVSARHFNRQRQQLYLTGLAEELINTTDIGSSPGSNADFILTGQDLYADRLNFVFGCTWSTLGLSVQSVSRVVSATRDTEAQRLHTRHVARHEFAHMRGLIEPSDFRNPDRREGIYSGHCADVCTMRQSITVKEALSQAIELQDHELAGFCECCVKKLISSRHQ